jgi:hypothetical protein
MAEQFLVVRCWRQISAPSSLPLRGATCGVYSVLAAENEPVRIGACRIEIELGVAPIALANVMIGGL